MAEVICFHYEDWTQHVGGKEPDTTMARYRSNFKAAAVERIGMVDETQFQIGVYYNHADPDINFSRASSLEDFEAAYPDGADYAWVYLEGKALLDSAGIVATSIENFVHPAPNIATIYVVGPDSSNIDLAGRENKTWVYIPVYGYSLYAETAGLIAFYDRFIKANPL